MLTLEGLIAVLSLCLTAFGLGYTIGGNHKKITAQPNQLNGYYNIYEWANVYR